MNDAERFFVDTNVLLYSSDPADRRKQDRARLWLGRLWENGAGCLSWQVLHEFYVNAVRKLREPAVKARATVHAFSAWQSVETNLGLIVRAWYWTDSARISYWDALIVAGAELGGCVWLLSEDFQAGHKFGSVRVINPFEATPDDFGLPARMSSG